MIYDAKTHALLTLFEQELEKYGKHDACGHHDKMLKAKERCNALAKRLIAAGVTLHHVREIE